MLTRDEKNLIALMLDFCEENWSAFEQRCKESGMIEEEIEIAIELLKKKVYR